MHSVARFDFSSCTTFVATVSKNRAEEWHGLPGAG
jgi:hypothetical protein